MVSNAGVSIPPQVARSPHSTAKRGRCCCPSRSRACSTGSRHVPSGTRVATECRERGGRHRSSSRRSPSSRPANETGTLRQGSVRKSTRQTTYSSLADPLKPCSSLTHPDYNLNLSKPFPVSTVVYLVGLRARFPIAPGFDSRWGPRIGDGMTLLPSSEAFHPKVSGSSHRYGCRTGGG